MQPGVRIRGRKHGIIRARRMARTKWLCEDCLAKGRYQTADVVDHIVPLAHGGQDVDKNTRNLCDDCHLTRTAEQFGRRRKVRISLSGWPEED